MDPSKCSVIVVRSEDGVPSDMSPSTVVALIAARESHLRYRAYVDKLGSDLFTVLLLAVAGLRAENILIGVLAGSIFMAAGRGLVARFARKEFERALRP